MNFSFINKFFFIFFLITFLNACSTQSIYQKVKIKKYDIPEINNLDKNNINLLSHNDKIIDFENPLILENYKNKNEYLNNIVIFEDNIFVVSGENELITFNYNTGRVISKQKINISFSEVNILVSLKFIENSFILAFNNGSIYRINLNGDIIWEIQNNKTINTPLTIINNQIILLIEDEIKSISLTDGSVTWAEIYDDLPIYQAKGGQLTSFINLLFFILPNNRVGSIDYSLGSIHNSKFDEIPLISTINNTKDKIYFYENFLVYLDEGKYLYTFNIFNNNFVLFKNIVNLSESNILFSNSLILKNGNYLQAININDGNTFWLINDDRISKKSEILDIRNTNTDIEIFLTNGDVLTINNKELVAVNNLNVGKVKKISFERHNIIVNSESGKTIIF